jgi:hypothetical protein
LNAPFIFESWQFLALRLCLRCNAWRTLLSLPLLDHDSAARVPINLGVPSEEDLHQNEVVFVFREKTQNLTPSHEFTRGREDYAEAEVAFVALDFNAVEVRRWAGFAIHLLVYEAVR